MSTELTPWKVGRLKLAEAKKLAARYGCQLPAGAKRPDYIAAIIAKIEAGEPLPDETPDYTDRQPGNKRLFDELTADSVEATEPVQPDEPESRHGGAREGAGRKKGVTLEQSRIDNLPTSPNRTVQYFIKWLFKVWARIADCKEIALDDDELHEFSVDTTQFLEFHGIRIPQGLAVDSKFIMGGCELIGGRFMIHKAHKARQAAKQQQEKEKDNEGQLQG